MQDVSKSNKHLIGQEKKAQRELLEEVDKAKKKSKQLRVDKSARSNNLYKENRELVNDLEIDCCSRKDC